MAANRFRFPRATRWAAAGVWGSVVLAAIGCGSPSTLAPVRGRVTYNGKPLEFGSVMLQPPSGQPARGTIGAGGEFEMSTNAVGDGATIGPNLVRVTCWEGQRPRSAEAGPAGEVALGKMLIPKRYASFEQSGLTVDVPPDGVVDVLLELNDAPAESR